MSGYRIETDGHKPTATLQWGTLKEESVSTNTNLHGEKFRGLLIANGL